MTLLHPTPTHTTHPHTASMVLSSVAVRSFVSTGQRCPTRDYADDMLLGMAAKSLGWDVVQSPFFHQVSSCDVIRYHVMSYPHRTSQGPTLKL